MSKLKEFIKWTDVALSLRELFDEVKETLKEHEEQFNELQQQNMLLLQQMQFQKEIIGDLKKRISVIESRDRKTVLGEQEEQHAERRQISLDPEN